ncbi:MAG TPA: asparagine synthase (glutamine-hydrolyzing) [Caulobacteraceae bacterium]|jgi:asparagine synthase (glutamine-hydrolysing)|nr:asparagine synthase (glutamine-hydrolyzing) [Caulobacteraceae bacterium]
MCAIAGLFDIKGSRPFDPARLRAMTLAMSHRGPDGAGEHLEPGVALGHRRLAIIDLAGGAQPMRTPDGAVTVTFNGEIYNFRELRAELEAVGAQFRTRSDTEVLLHGWRAWGESLFARLEGMFALALWDATGQQLVLARDRFGKKPLHYAIEPSGVLAFASEIKGLTQLPEIPRDLDPFAVEDFFAYGYIPDPRTIYRAIRKLPPAHLMVVRRGGEPRIRPYWSLLDRLASPSAIPPEALIDELREAVRRRLISDVPIGALLSGGVDSSAVTALMAEASEAPVRSFSIGFADPALDETPYARSVSDLYGARHEVLEVSPADFEVVDRLPQIFDEPYGDVSAVPTLAVCAHARQGVTVALSGDGGDEAVAGYRRYGFHMAQDRLRRFVPEPVRAGVAGQLAEICPRGAWLPRPLRARTTLKELTLDPASAYVRMVQALPREIRERLLTEDFRRRLGGYDADELVRSAYNAPAPLDPLQRAQYADAVTYLPGDILVKTDRTSMAHSLELRSPMLDPAFFVAAFNLRPELKRNRLRGGKAILKQGLEAYLPREVLYRRKTGFAPPISEWLRGPLREHMLALPQCARLRDCGVIELDEVRRMAEAHAAGVADNSKPLWLVWVFAAFLQHAGELRAGERLAA